MSKLEVLAIFAQAQGFLRPDRVRAQLLPRPDRRSLYSYLGRLRRQGLLERHPAARRGQLMYRLTARGRARLEYFRQQSR